MFIPFQGESPTTAYTLPYATCHNQSDCVNGKGIVRGTRKIFFTFLCSLVLLLLESSILSAAEKTLFQKDSLYQYIAVIEDTLKRERYIFNNRRDLIQGGIYINNPEKLLFEYNEIAFISLAFLDREPQNVLCVGLGAGSWPRYFNSLYPDADVDVVEIDPDMVDVARKYFHFKESSRMKVHTEDGRVFIKRTSRKYDIVFLDAYQSGDIPFHLTTVEFLREVKSRLKEGGVVVANILSPFKNKFFNSMVVTYEKVFPHTYIFKGRRSNNFVFVAVGKALRDKEELTARAQKIQSSRKMDIDLAGISWRCEHCEEYKTEAKVLTDDFAPVNLYQHMKVK